MTTQLAQTFNQEAELYNEIRPHYPEELFDSLVAKSNLSSNANLLEIGPGTGQATKPLAERGFAITAVEPGNALASVLRRELQNFPKVKIVNTTFEEADLPAAAFDLVFAATSFHWVKPEVKFAKSHKLLKPSSNLAIIGTHHVSDQRGDEFFHASQAVYDRYYSGSDKPALPLTSELKPVDLDDRLFKLACFERFSVVIDYTAEQYAKLLNTYSPTLALPASKRKEFLGDIESLINRTFNGKIKKYFVMSLTLAQKVA